MIAISFPSSTGNSGDVLLEVDRLQLTNGGEMNTSTVGQGTGGALTIRGMNGPDSQSNLVFFSGTDTSNGPSALIADALGFGPQAGNAKAITIQAKRLAIDNGGRVVTRTAGDGDAGDINLHVDRLELTDGGQIFSGTGSLENGRFTGTGGPGNGGDLNIKAAESIHISGQDQQGFLSGLFSNAQFGSGDAGDLTISTPHLTLNGGLILASSEVGSSGKAGSIMIDSETTSIMNAGTISVASSGGGASGSITLRNSDTFLSESGTISAKVSTGKQPGGNIFISAGQVILLRKDAHITAESSGLGNAGNITLTDNSILINRGRITTQANLASGGNITLQATEKIQLLDSTIASSVQGDATTAGGDINIDPDFIILQNSQILAKAIAGQGGNISLTANKAVLVDSFSSLDASSELGISGSINIRSPIQNLSSTIAPLPQESTPVTALYGSRCVAGAEGNFSTFVDSKTDTLPPTPGVF
ncbi:MAG TPA: hypothetical protein PKK23_06510 [Nitrospirales bacterium]|nr:hypothetical protein [Nitrospirales bacterium]